MCQLCKRLRPGKSLQDPCQCMKAFLEDRPLLQAQLSTELASRGLPKSGLKAELAQRLFDAVESEGQLDDVTEAPTAEAPSSPSCAHATCHHARRHQLLTVQHSQHLSARMLMQGLEMFLTSALVRLQPGGRKASNAATAIIWRPASLWACQVVMCATYVPPASPRLCLKPSCVCGYGL